MSLLNQSVTMCKFLPLKTWPSHDDNLTTYPPQACKYWSYFLHYWYFIMIKWRMYHDLIHCYNNTCFHTWIIEYTVQRKPLGCDRKHANLWLKCKLLLALNKTCVIGCHGAKQFLRKFSNLLSVKNLISHECRKKVINEIKTVEQRWDAYQRITTWGHS